MTPHEREIIKKVKPLVDQGDRGRALRIYQNLTSNRRTIPKCKCGCGKPVLAFKYGTKTAKFATQLCVLIWKRSSLKSSLLPLVFLATATVIFGAEVKLAWVNASNAVPVWTHIYYGTPSGGNIQIVTNKPGITNCTIRNLRFGTAYFFRAMHMGPLGKEWSEFSNEVTTKTRIGMEATGSKANVGRMRSP